jgi:hypothetical protein
MWWIQQFEIETFDSYIKHIKNFLMEQLLEFDLFIKINSKVSIMINEDLI